MSTSQTTNVLGYYNKNTFPINLASDQLGLNVQIPPSAPGKPSYLIDRNGRKINDSRLDVYASAGGLLVKEFSPTPVPLILLRGQQEVSPSTSVTAGVAVKGAVPAKAVAPAQPGMSSPSVGAMSVEEAMKAGLIPKSSRTPDRFEKAPNEDLTGDAARAAPFINQMGPRPPSAVRAAAPSLKTAPDAAAVASLDPDSPALLSDITSQVMQEAGVTPVAGAPEVTGVMYDGKQFTRPGDLRKYVKRKIKDPAQADEIINELMPRLETAGVE